MNESFKYQQLAVRKDDLQKIVLRTIETHNKEKAAKLGADLKKLGDEERLKIAFVGQHNAGKSTIISALTGNRQIKISNNVETDVPEDYRWEGVLLTDTPGLYAGKKEEHDALSLQKIKESDLLVFCCTSSLFDDLLIKKFSELAYNQSYKSKIFLVINKMNLEEGDFEQLMANYKETLIETFEKEGCNFSDFPVSFIDAHDYIEGLETQEQELIDYSRFNSFVAGLNKYISEKQLLAKLDTPCRIMIGSLDDEITNTSTELDKSIMVLLRQSDSIIRKYKNDLKFYMRDIEEQLRNEIMAEANKLIEMIGEENQSTDSSMINQKIQDITQRKIAEIQEHIDEILPLMDEEISKVVNSDIGNYVISQIDNDKIDIDMEFKKDFSKFFEGYRQVAAMLNSGGQKILEHASKKAGESVTLLGGVSQVSGSALHSAVLGVGHFFNVSFKPWQAVTIASNIAKATVFLSGALAAVSVVVEIYSSYQDKQRSEKIKNDRREAFNQFSSIASDIVTEIEKRFDACEKELFDSKTKEIDSIRSKLIESNQNNSAYVQELKKCREQLYLLTDDISKA